MTTITPNAFQKIAVMRGQVSDFKSLMVMLILGYAPKDEISIKSALQVRVGIWMWGRDTKLLKSVKNEDGSFLLDEKGNPVKEAVLIEDEVFYSIEDRKVQVFKVDNDAPTPQQNILRNLIRTQMSVKEQMLTRWIDGGLVVICFAVTGPAIWAYIKMALAVVHL